MLTHLDLFSGIGGFALAARWAGFETTQFVEIEPFCQRVLAKNFQGVPCHGDIETFDATSIRGTVGIVTGGFPCQDVSGANPNGKGIDGERSGLWREMLRIVLECRPMFVLAENSHYLRTRGADRVLGDLEAGGYSVGAFVVGAGNAGAPHWRKRAFVVAADASREQGRRLFEPWVSSDAQATALGGRLDTHAYGLREGERRIGGSSIHDGDRHDPSMESRRHEFESGPFVARLEPWRGVEPPIPGVDAGFPGRLDRARALGNAVVPQVAYVFLKAIYDQIRDGQACP